MLYLYQADILNGGFNDHVQFLDEDIDLIADKHCIPNLYDFNDPEVRRIAVGDSKTKFKNLTCDQVVRKSGNIRLDNWHLTNIAMLFGYSYINSIFYIFI